MQDSGFLNGMPMKEAIGVAIDKIEELGIGNRKVNFRMRDAGFSRQRYWGEPFPIIWSDGIALPLNADELPLELPFVDKYQPGPEGEGPLANITEWVNLPNGNSGRRETSTMPGYAGSSWYFLRYMDPKNETVFCDRKASDYWGQVDIYIGGTEHAVGHLLYSRMWTKILFDLGHVGYDEPFKKLLNQGMIQGSSRFVYRVRNTNVFLSSNRIGGAISEDEKLTTGLISLVCELDRIHVDVNMVDGVELDIAEFRKWKNGEYAAAEFILDGGKYVCGVETEKMSKSKYNTVNPDVLVDKFGADTFRMYEMFLGPVEQSKPWDSKGIEGVHRFLRKLWRLFYDDLKGKVWNEDKPTDAEWKVLHRTIKKIEEDTERFSFNTAVSTFMICVNELSDMNCHKREVLEPLLFLLAPYAPHISEELCSLLGTEISPASGGMDGAAYPVFNPALLVESSKEYPVSINGKVRTNIVISLDATQVEVEQIIVKNEVVQKWLDGNAPKKVIYVKNKMVNIVI